MRALVSLFGCLPSVDTCAIEIFGGGCCSSHRRRSTSTSVIVLSSDKHESKQASQFAINGLADLVAADASN